MGLRNVFVSDERKPDEQRFITAREGRLLSDEVNRRVTLRLLDGAIHETSPNALQKYREVRFRLYDITLVLENPLVKQGGAPKGDREMSLAELRQATEKAVDLKGNPNPYLVEIHKKFAIPAACLVFSFLGVPLGIRAHRGGRWGAFVALLPIVLFYYFGLTTRREHRRPRPDPALARDVGAQHDRGRPRPVPVAGDASRSGRSRWSRCSSGASGRRSRPPGAPASPSTRASSARGPAGSGAPRPAAAGERLRRAGARRADFGASESRMPLISGSSSTCR